MGRRNARSRARRQGFSLIEVLVAMTLLSVVFISLGNMSIQLSQRSRHNDLVAKRTAVLTQEANKFNAMPYANLAGLDISNKTLRMGDFTFTRRLERTIVGVRTTIKIVIVPRLSPTKTDSVFVIRTQPAGSPLCTTC